MDYRVKQFIHKKADKIRELSQRFNSFYSEDITPIKIIAFLLQFEEYEKIKYAFKLISNINFLSSRKITHLIKIAYSEISEKDKSKPLIAPLGTSQDSSALVCYSLFKDIFADELNALESVIEVSQIENELKIKNPTSLIFIDDNITSGTQLRDFFEELFSETENRELIPTPLSDITAAKLRQIPIYVCYAIRLTKECESVVNEIKLKHKVNLKILYGAEDYYNYTEFSSPIIESPEESSKMKQFIIEYSKSLYHDKDWSKEKLYDRLIGYGNLGKLTVFNHNVPKSLIPFFWKAGLVNGKPWIPLFPERQELKKIEKNNFQFETYLYEVANILLTEINITREPEISFYFDPLDGIENEEGGLVINVPDDESLLKVFKKIKRRKCKYKENEFKLFPGYDMNLFRKPMNIDDANRKTSLSEEKYNTYKKYIDKVNHGLMKYASNFEQYLTELSGKGRLNVNINNSGIGAANNVRLRLSYNSGEVILEEPKILISPYLKPFQVKEVSDFQNQDQSFDDDDLFEPFSYNREISGKRIEKGREYSLIFNFPKISHKDNIQRTIDYIIIDRDKEYLTLSYKLLWDESIEGIEGEVKIHLNKIAQNEKVLSYLYNQVK